MRADVMTESSYSAPSLNLNHDAAVAMFRTCESSDENYWHRKTAFYPPPLQAREDDAEVFEYQLISMELADTLEVQDTTLDGPITTLDESRAKLDEQITTLEESSAKLDKPITTLDKSSAKLDEPITTMYEPITTMYESSTTLDEPITMLEYENTAICAHDTSLYKPDTE